ncbi:MAG: S9 family peptidase [Gemmatimonadota bacterium]|nr:MAG: S9 family peptidase [Gemmatimonadota bacterium]
MYLSLLLFLIPIQGTQTPQAPVTIEEYLALRHLSAVQVSPDGGSVAFTSMRAALEENGYRTELYVWRPATGARTVATGFTDISAPRWSLDGASISFVSRGQDTDDEPQLWLLGVSSDDPPLQLSEIPGGVLDYGWAPDGSIYALTGGTASSAREIWKVLVPGGTAEYVWGGDPGIREIAVSPDGAAIVYSTNGSGAAADYLNYDLRILDPAAQRTRRLTSRPGPEVAPIWSPDSRTVVFQAPQHPADTYSQTELLSVPASGGTPQVLTDSFDRAVVEHCWPPGGDLLFTAALGTQTHLFAIRGDGAVRAVAQGGYNVGSFDATPAGASIFAALESATAAGELWHFADGRFERLTEFNAATRDWRLGRQQVIRWTAPDGLNIEGLLVYPIDYQEGRRYPLLVNVQAGPRTRARDVLTSRGDFQLFAAQGYAVLAPNPRGSSGYGEDFATARRSDLAGGDIVDLVAGLDAVIGMGIADPQRLAIYGSGYGAEMTSWTLTTTPRFGAAVAVFEAASSSGWTAPAFAAPAPDRSATANARSIHTPLLIIEGPDDFDTLVPRTQPAELYQALSDLGRPVEYVELSSGAGPAVSPRRRSDLFFRQLRWFDRHLKFGGADLFEFYLTGEWVSGPAGWELRVESAAPRADYTGMAPESGRYIEVALTLRPAESALRDRTAHSLSLDPATGLSLLGPDGTLRRLTGTVTEVFGRETLILGMPGPFSVPAPQIDAATTLNYRLAFEIPNDAAEYRLLLEGFRPVRIWVPAAD